MHSDALSPPKSSPFIQLGPDLFEILLRFITEQPIATPLNSNAYRRLLPFAICCTDHYRLTIRYVTNLCLLPLNFPVFHKSKLLPPIPPFPVVLYEPAVTAQTHPLPSARKSNSPIQLPHLPHALKRFPNLHTLHIHRSRFLRHTSIEAIIRSVPQLRQIRINAVHQLNLKTLRALTSFTRLQVLELPHCRGIREDQSIQAAHIIAKLTHLTRLSVADWQITDDFVYSIAQLPHLTSLDISVCTKLTSLTCTYLGQFATKLEILKFSCSANAIDSRLAHLTRCSNLTYINLAMARCISDDTFLSFGGAGRLPNLHTVMLSQCRTLSSDTVKYLSSNTNIRRLDLSYCDYITEKVAASLRRLQMLEDIDLRECTGVNDQVIQALAQCKNLRRISLSGCTSLTDASAIALCSSVRKEPYELLNIRKCDRISSEAKTLLSRKVLRLVTM